MAVSVSPKERGFHCALRLTFKELVSLNGGTQRMQSHREYCTGDTYV